MQSEVAGVCTKAAVDSEREAEVEFLMVYILTGSLGILTHYLHKLNIVMQ